MRRILPAERGMTLVELLVALAVLAILLLPATMMLYAGYRSSAEEQAMTTALDGARTTMTMILDDLRKYDFAYSSYDDSGMLIKHADNNVLTIKPDLVYSFDPTGVIKKNDEIVCINVKTFNVTEDFDGFESNVIHINIRVQTDKNNPDQDVVLQESYWRRIPVNR